MSKKTKSPRVTAFIDTNALLHYPPLKDLDWPKICNAEKVILMLCLPVLKELDKYKSDPRLGDRAKKRIREIETHTEAASEARPGVKVAVCNLPLRSSDFPNTLSFEIFDDQIVHYALKHHEQTGDEVAIITEDLGMRVRCRAHAVRPITPPENQRLPNELSEEVRKLKEAERRLADLQNRLPKLVVTLSPSADEPLSLTRPRFVPAAERVRAAKEQLHPDNIHTYVRGPSPGGGLLGCGGEVDCGQPACGR